MAISLGDIKKKKITVSPLKNTNTNNTTYNVAPSVNNQREQQTYNLGDVRKNNITVTPLSERPKSKILAPSPQETMTINSINNKINENISKQIVSGGIQNDIHNMNMANIGAKSNKVTFESAYKDTGKKYGDYYYDNYESFKDKVIYERDGKYFLKTNKGYEPIGKLDKDGNVKTDIEFTKKDNKISKDKQFIKNQDVNLISKYNEDKQELEKAKNLGYKDNLTKITSKEYDKAQKVLKEYKKQMQLSDKDYDKWLKTGKLPKKHGYFLDGDKTPEKAEDYRVKLLNGEIKKYDQQGFDVEKQIYMDTHNMSDEQKQQYISFITGKELPSNNEKSTFFKSSESDNAVVATLGTIGNAGLDFMKGTGKFIEGVSDFAENLIGSSLETSPIVSATGNKKQDVTTTRNNIEYTGYKLNNKNYWYDRKNDKLYDENWNRIQSFNLDRFEKQYTYSNGIAEFGRQMKEQTVKDEASETFDEILHGNDLRKVSVLGNKSEGMLESLGQAVPLMGAGGSVGGLYGNNAAIATTSGLTFSSSYGNAKTEALRNGATEKEAMETAFVQASAETISEQFFDSIPGAKSAGWGEKLVGKVGNGVEKYLGSKTAKIVTKTLDISGEGFEEIISNMLTAGGNDIVHYFDKDYNYGMENQTGNILEDMKSAMTSQDSMDSFVSAIITSAILNGGSAKVNSTKINKIVKTYAQEYNMSIEEAKARLKISDDGIEFDTSNINQTQNTPNLPKIENDTQEKYSNVKPPMVIKYQATDNERINNFRQSAVKEGMIDSQKTTNAMNVIEKVISDKDYNVRFDRTITNLDGKSVDGKININKNGEVEIALNPNSDRAVEFLLTHEITHAIETKELRGIILDYANKNSEFKSALQDLQKTYGTINVNDEVIADISGQILGNQEFINSLSMQNTEQSRGFISKVYHSIQRLLNKLTTKGRYRNFVEDLETKWREAYRLATNETAVNNLKSDSKYAIANTKLDNSSFSLQKRYDDIINQREYLRQEIQKLRKQKEEIIKEIPNYSIFKKYDELTSIDKLINENLEETKKLYNQKQELKEKIDIIKETQNQKEIDEINIYGSQFKREQLNIIKQANPMLDDYHVGIRNVSDIKTFDEVINDEESFAWGDYTRDDAIRDLKNGYVTVYSSYPIDNGVFVSTSYQQAFEYAGHDKSNVHSKKVPLTDVAWISGDEGQYAKVEQSNNSKAVDNKGRTLSKEQQEYFKDSKVRDENGNLLTMYHGSNSEFTIFDISKSGESNETAKVGFWFTPSKQGAENFASDIWYGDKKPTTYEVYLNIKNPKIYEPIDTSEQNNKLTNELKTLKNEYKDIASNFEYNNYGITNVVTMYQNYSGNLRSFAQKEGYRTEEKIQKYIDEVNRYIELTQQIRNLENELKNIGYDDSYEQFRTDIYKLAGKTAEDANLGGIGMALDNGQQIVEKYLNLLKEQGYDGIIIKNTRFDADTMGNNNDQYVAFSPNQIKNINNTSPTTNDDIRYSQKSSSWQEHLENNYKPTGTRTYFDEITNKKIAPLNPNVITKQNKVKPPIAKEYQKNTIEEKIETSSIKSISNATKIANKYLDLSREERQSFQEKLKKYENKTYEEISNGKVYNEIKDIVRNFSTRPIENIDEEMKSVKRDIRNRNIKIDDNLKNQIDDYNEFRKSMFGKLKLSKNGTSIDSLYNELSNIYPYYFDSNITTEADMLYELADFMDKSVVDIQRYNLSEKEIDDCTSKVFNEMKNGLMTDEKINSIKEKNDKKENKLTHKEVKEQLLSEMNLTPEDLSVGDDIKALNFQLTDPIRVNEKVFGQELGKKVNEATIEKTKHNEAERTRWLNSERNDIKELGIKPRSKESAAVQKYGEKQYVNKYGETVEYGDKELMTEFPNVKTQEKIKRASQMIRNKYDKYIDQINETLTALGYDEIPKRPDYMRHFQELGDIFSQTGVPFNLNDMSAEDLPTDINGLTEFNKPGKNWFASAQKRYGNKTTYDAITGIDGYLEGASNLIFHTEDIQRYRALSGLIRDSFGKTKGFENLDNLSNKEALKRIDDIQNNKLSKYVAWLDEQANSLAGKKGAIDRGTERFLGRRGYTILNTLKKQVGSNMTGFNVRSAMTNFISSTIAASKTNKIAMVKGTISTIKNMFHNDGFINKSDFLTSRFGSDSLSPKLWDKISNAGQILMTGSDYFTSNQIVRSKYYEGLQKGMTESEAIKYADDFGARVMGDRSKGATAEAFNSKTLGLLTQFQLETNNQWQFMVHDTKMDYQKNSKINGGLKAGATVLFQLGQLCAYSYFFNEFFEAVTGNRAAFDPIDILLKLLGWGDDDEDKTFEERMKEAGSELSDAIPFTSLFGNGGRMPISEALAPLGTTFDYITGGKNSYGGDVTLEDVKNDTLSTLPYYLLPTGYSQIKKTTKGLSMFSNDKEIKGSYSKSGRLRFPVKDTIGNRIKSGLFGEYASKEAREYFNQGRAPLTDKQQNMYKTLDIPISEYWTIKNDISSLKKELKGEKSSERREEIYKYIDNLDITQIRKDILKKQQYKSYKSADNKIIKYINSSNMSKESKKEILKELGLEK